MASPGRTDDHERVVVYRTDKAVASGRLRDGPGGRERAAAGRTGKINLQKDIQQCCNFVTTVTTLLQQLQRYNSYNVTTVTTFVTTLLQQLQHYNVVS